MNNAPCPTPTETDATDKVAREWWVFSTCLTTVELMLVCKKTGAFGVIEKPTIEEWSQAYHAPSEPYRWMDESRVVVKKENALG